MINLYILGVILIFAYSMWVNRGAEEKSSMMDMAFASLLWPLFLVWMAWMKISDGTLKCPFKSCDKAKCCACGCECVDCDACACCANCCACHEEAGEEEVVEEPVMETKKKKTTKKKK
jgi:hypothetical protein